MVTLNWFNTSLIVGAIQSFFIIANLSFLKKTHQSNKLLKLLLSVIGISLVLRLSYSAELYYSMPHLSIMADFVMYIFGPIFYLYVIRRLYENAKFDFRVLIHFIPLFIFLISLGYLLKFSAKELIAKDIQGEMDGYYIVLMGSAILQIGAYLYLVKREMKEYENHFKRMYTESSKLIYLDVITNWLIICLLLWSIAFVTSLFLPIAYNYVTNLSYQLAFLGISTLTFVIGYFAIRQPEILRVTIEKKQKYSGIALSEFEMIEIQKKLETLFEKEKIYLNEELSLTELSKEIGVNHTYLSRVINEHYDKNFFDFVNSYRAREFVRLASNEEYNNYTLLGIAFEAGFKTKTTFNKFFKKEFDATPKEFLKRPQEELDKLISNLTINQ